MQNPDLSTADQDIRAAEARLLQAGLRPNPSVIGDIQDFEGSRQYYQGANGAQITVSIAQLVELGGKRAARLRAARCSGELARWDYESRRLEILAQTAQAFIATVAAQERLPLIEADRKLAVESMPTIEQRIAAGATSPVEKTRAEIFIADFDVELQQARRDLAQARVRLAAQWGALDARFSAVSGSLEERGPPLSLATLATRLEGHPALARFSAELDQRKASLTLAKTAAVPDVTFTPGYRHHNDPPSDNVAVFTAEVGLPLFDRNQGNIQAARAELAKVAPEHRAVDARLHAELNEAYSTLEAARAEIATLETRILPAARETFRLINESMEAGKFSYLEVLDARRTLTTGRQELLVAQAALASAAARIEGLTGGPLFPASDPGRKRQMTHPLP